MARQELIADYADLGVSCGYVGNVYYGPVRDDRSFRVFTSLAFVEPMRKCTGAFAGLSLPKSETGVRSIVVLDVPRDHVGVYEGPVEFDTPAIRAQLDALRERLASGELRLMGKAA